MSIREICVLILLANFIQSQTSLNQTTFSSSAVNAIGEDVIINATIGQGFVGEQQSDNTILSAGLWGSISSILLEVDDLVPMEFAISNAYPNPFNPTVNIDFSIPEVADINIQIFDLLGRSVFSHKQQFSAPGNYKFKWNGLTNSGTSIASGVYLVNISHKSNLYQQKITYLK